MNSRSFYSVLRHDIAENKKLLWCTAFVTVLCFGFAITHFSIGVDDPAGNYYLHSREWGSMIQQGRLLHVALERITGTVEFLPFFNNFLAACLFCGSALAFCGLFQMVSGGKLSEFSLIAFATAFISYPILNEKFIYDLDAVVTMISYGACALALGHAWQYLRGGQRRDFWLAVVLTMVSISSYESFVFLYICGVFALFCVEILVGDEKLHFGKAFREGLKYAGILLLSMAVYYGIVFLVQFVTGQFGIFKRNSEWSLIKTVGLGPVAKNLWSSFQWAVLDSQSVSMRVFRLFTMLGFPVIAWCAIRKKSPVLFLAYGAFWLGNFGIHIISGTYTLRMAQTQCLFTAMTLMVLVQLVQSRPLPKAAAALAVSILVTVQAADMNRWFYNDYIRYQKEAYVVHTVATDLQKGWDLSKPVVFTRAEHRDYLDEDFYPYGGDNGWSVINWSLQAFDDSTTPLLFEFFRMQGYNFLIKPTQDQALLGQEYAQNQPVWPMDGYIQEYDEIIVVHF